MMWLIRMCHDLLTCDDVTHSYVPWLIHMWWCDSFSCIMIHFSCAMTQSHVSRLIHTWRDSFTCDMTHAHDPSIFLVHPFRQISRVTWLILTCHDSVTCVTTHSHVTWLIHMWHDSCSWPRHLLLCIHFDRFREWHDSFSYSATQSHVTWPIHMSDMTHSHECHESFARVIWLTHFLEWIHFVGFHAWLRYIYMYVFVPLIFFPFLFFNTVVLPLLCIHFDGYRASWWYISLMMCRYLLWFVWFMCVSYVTRVCPWPNQYVSLMMRQYLLLFMRVCMSHVCVSTCSW